MKRIFSGLAVLVALAIGSVATAQDSLRFGIDPTFKPMEFKNPDGSLTGFSYEVGEAICAELGRDCVWVESDWDGIIPGLLAGNFDAIISSMSITPKRMEVLDFTSPYQRGGSRFVVPEGTELDDSQGGLDGVKIGVQRGTVDHDYVRANYPDADIRPYPGQDEIWLDLAAGRLDAGFVGNIPAAAFFETDAGKGFESVGSLHNDPAIYGVGAGIAVRPGEDELLNDLNTALATIIGNGVFREINDRYFDYDITGGLLE